MKNLVLLVVFIALTAGLAWFIRSKPARAEEEDKKPATEVPVHVGRVARATLRSYVTAYGVVEPEPAGERPAASARIAPAVPGVVVAVNCAEGQRVEKGAVLFQQDSRAADVAVQKATDAAVFAEKNLERQKKVMQVGGTSQKLLLESEQALTAARNDLAAAQTQRALLRVQAPLSGTITRLNVEPGEAVELASVLAEIIDLDRLVVSVQVPAAELATLKGGGPAEVLVDNSAKPIPASLTYISPEIEPKTSTALVRAALPPGCGLRPGQFVTLRIVNEEHKDRLAVPAGSVVKDAESSNVIALVQGDRAVQTAVKAGLRDGDLVEVEAEGLREGATVVTDGAYGLPKETKVRIQGGEPVTNAHE